MLCVILTLDSGYYKENKPQVLERMAAANAPRGALENSCATIWLVACARYDAGFKGPALNMAILSAHGQAKRSATLGWTKPSVLVPAVVGCLKTKHLKSALSQLLDRRYASGLRSMALFTNANSPCSGVCTSSLLHLFTHKLSCDSYGPPSSCAAGRRIITSLLSKATTLFGLMQRPSVACVALLQVSNAIARITRSRKRTVRLSTFSVQRLCHSSLHP